MPKRSPAKKAARDAFHHGDLRNALLAAATAAVAQRGVEGLSIRKLAQELGVVHRAAYRHFADKNDLLSAVLTAAYDRLAAKVVASTRSRDVRLRLREAAWAHAEFAFEEPEIFLALAGPRINQAGEYPLLEAAIERAVAPVLAAVESGQAEGVLPAADARAAATFFLAALQGLLTQILHRRLRLRPAQRKLYLAEVSDRLFAGLQLKPT